MMFCRFYYWLCIPYLHFLSTVTSGTAKDVHFATSDSINDLETSVSKKINFKSIEKATISVEASESLEDEVINRNTKIEVKNGIPFPNASVSNLKAHTKLVSQRTEPLSIETDPTFQTNSFESLADYLKDLIESGNSTIKEINKEPISAIPYVSNSLKRKANLKEKEINQQSTKHDNVIVEVTDNDLTAEDNYPNIVKNNESANDDTTKLDLFKRLHLNLSGRNFGLSETSWQVKTNKMNGTKNGVNLEMLLEDTITTINGNQELITDKNKSNVTLKLEVFGKNFKAHLDTLKIEKLMPNAKVTIYDNENTKNISILDFRDLHMYEGALEYLNGSYVCGTIVDSFFTGILMSGNGTIWYLERPEHGANVSKSTTTKETDISFKNCGLKKKTHDDLIFSGCKKTKDKITCFEGSVERKHNKNSTARISLSDDPKSTPRPSNFPKNASCVIEISSDPTHFVKVHNQSITLALRELLTIFLQANHVFNHVDFDGDGKPKNLNLRVGQIAMYASYQNERRSSNESVMDQKLNTFLKRSQNGCLSILFLSDHLDPEEPVSIIYGGGDCRNGTHPSTNVAVINMIGPKNRSSSLLSMSYRITKTISEMMGSLGKDCLAPILDSSGKIWNSYSFGCSRRSMAKTLAMQGFCLEDTQDHHALELKAKQGSPHDRQCGNGIVERGEECDCGQDCQKNYSCCVPSGKANQCHYDKSKGHECEWTDPCCTMSCKIVPKGWKQFCGRGDSSCGPADAYCDGRASKCPHYEPFFNFSDGERCGPGNLDQEGAGTCKGGRCNSTVCRDAGLEDCRCEKMTRKNCKVCCRKQGKNSTCVPAEDFGVKSKTSNFFYRYPGLPCSIKSNEFCDDKGACTSKLSGSAKATIVYSTLIGKGISATALLAWTVFWRILYIRLV